MTMHIDIAQDSIPSYADVVNNVRDDRPEGLQQLYALFKVLSGSLRKQMGFVEFEDRLHDVYLMVIEAIRDGRLREPEALSSYIHGVARLSTCSKVGVRARHRRLSGSLEHWVKNNHGKSTPEEQLAKKQRLAIMRDLLRSLTERDREIITRFYLHEQPKHQICLEMDLTDTQFRLAKSRAKQKLGRMGGQFGTGRAA